MSTEVVAIRGEDFAAMATHDGTSIRALLEGNADYAEAKRLGVGEVVIDLEQLELMSSSCFKCVVSWVTDIQELGAEAQYKVRFLSNTQLHWQ